MSLRSCSTALFHHDRKEERLPSVRHAFCFYSGNVPAGYEFTGVEVSYVDANYYSDDFHQAKFLNVGRNGYCSVEMGYADTLVRPVCERVGAS